MRQTILLFMILVTGFVFGQNYISISDLKLDDGKLTTEKFIELRSGENNLVNVKLNVFGDESLKDYDFNNLTKIINTISETAKYNLKTPSTYIPNTIVLSKRPDNTWYSNIFYSGQNDYGGKKDCSSIIIISDKGEIITNLK